MYTHATLCHLGKSSSFVTAFFHQRLLMPKMSNMPHSASAMPTEAASSLRASLRSSGDFSGSVLASSSSTSYAVRARSKGPLLASDHHDGDASRSLRRLSRDRQESAVQEKPQSEDSMSVGLTLEPQSRRSSATTTLPSVAAQAPGHSGSSAR
jgi:hypothetical protein